MTDLEKFVQRMFPVFAKNLAFYQPHLAGSFMCPLCLTVFDSPNEHWRLLSEAHIIPKSLDGKEVTLACKACNSFIGAHIEGQEHKRLKDYKRFLGLEPGGKRANLTLETSRAEGVTINAFLSTETSERGRGLMIHLDENRSDPIAFRKSLDIWRKEWATKSGAFNLAIGYSDPFDERKAALTSLSMAYLRLFHEIGYEWIMTPVAASIRRQLADPEQDLITPHLFSFEARDDLPSLFVILEPPTHRGFLICLPPTIAEPDNTLVWIPAFHDPYPAEQPEDLNKLELKQLTSGSVHHRLTDSRFASYWHGLFYPDQSFQIDWGLEPDQLTKRYTTG